MTRPGLDVRAPSHVASAKPSKDAPRDALTAALQQPIDMSDLALAVSWYSAQGPGGTVRLLVSAEIGTPTTAPAAEWGLIVTQGGQNVVKTRGRIPAGSERPRIVSTSVDVPPGAYHLRVAALDVDERAGVLKFRSPPASRTLSARGSAISSSASHRRVSSSRDGGSRSPTT